MARSKYEEPTNCITDPGIELGCAQNWKALEEPPETFSWDSIRAPIGFCKFLSHAVLNAPSAVVVSLSETNSVIR